MRPFQIIKINIVLLEIRSFGPSDFFSDGVFQWGTKSENMLLRFLMQNCIKIKLPSIEGPTAIWLKITDFFFFFQYCERNFFEVLIKNLDI